MAMYSCVPRQRAGEVLVQPVGQDRLRLLRRAGVALDEVVERALGVEHQRVQVTGPVALHLGRRVGQRLHAQRVGQAPGRVDGDHAGAAAGPRRRQGEGGRHGRLADATRSAAHDDRALRHQLRQRRRASGAAAGRAPPSGRRLTLRPRARAPATAPASAAANAVGLGGADGGLERRDQQMGQGQLAAEPLDLLGGDGVAGQAEAPGLLERGQVVRRSSVTPAAAATSDAGRSSPTGSGSQALTMTGPSCTPALSSRV